jgi:hypothetical protein
LPIQVPDHDEPGGDPDPRLQRQPGRRVEPGYRLNERQPGPHRALGVVLVGPRISEIGEHAVAHVFGDKPAGTLDDRGSAAVAGTDHRPQILEVEPRRQGRRADQIAEHHRQLAPFGRRRRRHGRSGPPIRLRLGNVNGCQSRNSIAQPQAMARARHANVFEQLVVETA